MLGNGFALEVWDVIGLALGLAAELPPKKIQLGSVPKPSEDFLAGIDSFLIHSEQLVLTPSSVLHSEHRLIGADSRELWIRSHPNCGVVDTISSRRESSTKSVRILLPRA